MAFLNDTKHIKVGVLVVLLLLNRTNINTLSPIENHGTLLGCHTWRTKVKTQRSSKLLKSLILPFVFSNSPERTKHRDHL